jgi:hypothetical protein
MLLMVIQREPKRAKDLLAAAERLRHPRKLATASRSFVADAPLDDR